MLIDKIQLHDLIRFIKNINSSSLFSCFTKTNPYDDVHQSLINLLSSINKKNQNIHISRLSIVFKYLLKTLLFKHYFNKINLLNSSFIQEQSYSFEIFQDLNLDFIRKIKNNSQKINDKLEELNKVINNENCISFIKNKKFEKECYDALALAIKYFLNTNNLQTEASYILFQKEIQKTCADYFYLLLENKNYSILVYTEKSIFRDELDKFTATHCIPHQILHSNVDVWVRDILIDTDKELYLRSRTVTKNGISLDPDISSHCMIDVTFEETSKYLDLQNYTTIKNFYARYNDYNRKKKYFSSFKRNIHESIRPLEGGNLFSVINKKGEKYYFIGVNALLNEIDIAISKSNYLKNSMNTCSFDSKLQFVLNRYKKIFNTNNVYYLPQWTYHLDLQMAYIGKSTFILHSFQETKKYLNISLPLFYDEIEKVINKIFITLHNCHFNVYKSCAIIHKDYSNFDGLWNGSNSASSFINGIDIQNEDKNFFLTIDSPNLNHKKYFKQFIKDKSNIDVNFFKCNKSTAQMTLDKTNESAGALRCQTNFIHFDNNRQSF